MRHDDQSNPKIISHKVRCYNCQRPAQAEKKTFYGTKPGEKYTGNLTVKKEIPVVDIDGKVRYNYELFTGKYIQKFGYFCSVNCGLVWACHNIQARFDAKKEKNTGLSDENKNVLSVFKETLKKASK